MTEPTDAQMARLAAAVELTPKRLREAALVLRLEHPDRVAISTLFAAQRDTGRVIAEQTIGALLADLLVGLADVDDPVLLARVGRPLLSLVEALEARMPSGSPSPADVPAQPPIAAQIAAGAPLFDPVETVQLNGDQLARVGAMLTKLSETVRHTGVMIGGGQPIPLQVPANEGLGPVVHAVWSTVDQEFRAGGFEARR